MCGKESYRRVRGYCTYNTIIMYFCVPGIDIMYLIGLTRELEVRNTSLTFLFMCV